LLKVQESSSYDEQKQASFRFPFHPLEIQVWNQIEQQKLSLNTLEPLGNKLIQNRDRITQDMNQSNIAIGNPNKLLNAKPNSLLIQDLVVGDRLWVIWTNAKDETQTIAQPITQKDSPKPSVASAKPSVPPAAILINSKPPAKNSITGSFPPPAKPNSPKILISISSSPSITSPATSRSPPSTTANNTSSKKTPSQISSPQIPT
jgi:hypothetical protein